MSSSDSSSFWKGGGAEEVTSKSNTSSKVTYGSNINSPNAKQMSLNALLKMKGMRQALRSSSRGPGLALDLILLLKNVPAGVMSRMTLLAGNANFISGVGGAGGEQAPKNVGDAVTQQEKASESSAPTVETRDQSKISANGGPSPNPNNKKDDLKKKDGESKSIQTTPLGTPVKTLSSIPPAKASTILPPLETPSSVLKNIIEINSHNNRIIESRVLSEFTREQLLSSSQECEVSNQGKKDTASKSDKEGTSSSTSKPTENSKFLETNLYWQNIESRTKHLVSLVSKSNSSSSGSSKHNLITHLDELFGHIYQHTETRSTAVQAGGVKVLAKVMKLNVGEPYIVNKTREILALLGNNPPTKGQGIKILAIDGGGVRGLVALEVLRSVERITGKRTHELFDYICGVSTGSILAFLLGVHKKTLDEAELLYKELSREIFSQNSFMGSAALLWSHSYYHTPTFEKILKKHCGEMPLITLARDPTLPRVSAISTVVNQERVCPYVFRTYALPPMQRPKYLGGCRYHMWEAVRASAAAPTYFEEIKLGNYLHQDGGILCNNPTSVAISEARTIWKDQPLQCVVSLGTGLMLSSRTDKNLNDLIIEKEGLSYLSWKGKFLKVLASATDTESVHDTLNELLPHSIYFRLNPYLSEVVRLDEAVPEKLERVQLETRAYLERNVEKVQFACKTLLREKGMGKKVADWWYQP